MKKLNDDGGDDGGRSAQECSNRCNDLVHLFYAQLNMITNLFMFYCVNRGFLVVKIVPVNHSF